jgi:hypothetical protein
MGSVHSQARILDHVSEELFVKVMNGVPIIEEEDTNGKCSRVVSGRTGAKGKSECRVFFVPVFLLFILN